MAGWTDKIPDSDILELKDGEEYALKIIGEPVESDQHAGSFKISTDHGAFYTQSGKLLRPLKKAALSNGGKITGRTLRFAVTGSGNKRRFSDVNVG